MRVLGFVWLAVPASVHLEMCERARKFGSAKRPSECVVNVSRRKCAHLAVQELSQSKQVGEVSNAMRRLVARQVANSLKVVARIWHACFLETTEIWEIRIEDMYRRMKTRLYRILGGVPCWNRAPN